MPFESQTASSRDNYRWLADDYRNVPDHVAWNWATIDESLWSSSFPYQLAILEAQSDGKTYSQQYVFTLPINPESLTNSMPFATTLQATFGGVVEQNGGVPLRPISFTGNLGVINDRDNGEALGGLMHTLGGIAGGTVGAVGQLVQSASSTISGPQFTENLYADSDVPERSTGYYQWLMLQRFLESYAEVKKTADGARYRLALYIWKEKAAYLLSPELFTLTRTNDKPLEYQYQFRATAFARINPHDIRSVSGNTPLKPVSHAGSRSGLTEALNRIQHARATVEALKNLPGAILGDFEKTVGGTLRSVGLLLKSLTSAAMTWADFPSAIQAAAEKMWREEGAIFDSAFRVDQHSRPAALQKAMSAELARVNALTTNDYRTMRQAVDGHASLYAAKLGIGDPRRAQGPIPRAAGDDVLRAAGDDDFRLLAALAEASEAIGLLLAVRRSAPKTSTLEYVAGLATQAGIQMRLARSKFAVPFPYGSNLERLALQYLGDATRWTEIAALNELRAPYIDEDGQDQELLANGRGNDVAVADASLLSLGCVVAVSSSSVLSEVRRVVAIQKHSPDYWTVTLSGTGDLDRLKLADQATLRFYLPGTTNSQQVIFIPSDSASNVEARTRYVPTMTDLERILQVGGVDGALTDKGDLVITRDGDWSRVRGLAALIQWARVALNTPLKSWPLLPLFGAGAQVGQSLADASAKDVLADLKHTFAMNDAFSGIASALVETEGPIRTVTLELGVRGVDSLLPVAFEVQQGD